jgi:DNA-binding IclR family transcriptional regulator
MGMTHDHLFQCVISVSNNSMLDNLKNKAYKTYYIIIQKGEIMLVQSIKRAVDIISLFSSNEPAWGVTQISQATGLNKATVWGLMTSLCQTGLLVKDPDSRKYRLGPKNFEMGMVYASTLRINQEATELAYRLSEKTGLTVRVGIWTGEHVLTTLDHQAGAPFTLNQIGPRVPAHCTALGKAILAFLGPGELAHYLNHTELKRLTPKTITDKAILSSELEDTRSRGYSVNRREYMYTRAGLGAPIFQSKGQLAGGISLSGAAEMILGDQMEHLLNELLACAMHICRKMGFQP